MKWHKARGAGRMVAAAIVGAALCAGAARGRAAAQPTEAPQAPQASQPTFRTEANYVRVDAFPTVDGAAVDDLSAGDFEVLEGGVPQRIEQFEHVVIRASVPQELRAEPATVAESRQELQNPRARVFVIFLDTGQVDVAGSHNIRKPLVDALDKLIGPEDLFAVMTPDMSPLDLTFARKTTTVEGFLARYWPWGDVDKLNPVDPTEDRYQQCYGPPGSGSTSAIAAEMIRRRREKLTLDALDNLVQYLRTAREERKAVIAITNGWLIFGPNPALAPQTAPAAPPIGVDPRGRLTGRTDPNTYESVLAACERDRFDLSMLDDRDPFRQLPERASRANVSFYPIDPRGLPAFDSPISAPLPLATDVEYLRTRTANLRTLAENTDGVAVVNSNDLARGFKRIVDDLSSYYLLGYYSTGKLDGKFHSIIVRVKRPGVRVRARRGYLAATPAAATSATRRAAAAAADPEAAIRAAETRAIADAVSPLAAYSRDVPLRLQVASGWKPGGDSAAALWVVGEIAAGANGGDSASDGFDAAATLTTTADATVASGRVSGPRGARTFRVELTSSQPLSAGDYVLRVTARSGSASIPWRETTSSTSCPSW